MNSVLMVSQLTLGILAAAVAALGLVSVGIHREERHMNLSAQPRTLPEILARKILGVYVRQPGALVSAALRSASQAGDDCGGAPPGHLPAIPPAALDHSRPTSRISDANASRTCLLLTRDEVRQDHGGTDSAAGRASSS